jgi:hypothetical protein
LKLTLASGGFIDYLKLILASGATALGSVRQRRRQGTTLFIGDRRPPSHCALRLYELGNLTDGCDRSQMTKALTPGSPAGQPAGVPRKVSALQRAGVSSAAVRYK